VDTVAHKNHAEALRTTLTLLAQSLPLSTVDAESLGWDRPMFVLRSASMERLQSFLRVARSHEPMPQLHIMSHVRDEAAVAAMVDSAFTFYPYPTPGPYHLGDIPSDTVDRLRSVGFSTLVFLDRGMTGEGLDDVKRVMVAIDEPRVVCYRADDTFARPADWRLHLGADLSYRLLEQYVRTQNLEVVDGLVVVPEGTTVMRPRPRVYPGTEPSGPGERPRYFLVTSRGLAASAWLASSLNLHPDITCSMGIDHPLVSMRWYYYNTDLIETKFEALRHAGEVRHGFYGVGMRERVRRAFEDRGVPLPDNLVRANPVRQLQHMYDELEWFEPQSRYYGNVHACFAIQALDYLKAAPTRHDVRLVNLIRHPLPRTEAAIRNLLNVAVLHADSDWHRGITEDIDAFAEAHPEMRRDIERQFGVDFRNVRNRAVFYSYYLARHNDAWGSEITDFPDACHVNIERLMLDRDYFSWLVWEVTGRELVASPDFLDRIYTDEHLQSGRFTGRGRTLGPRAQYEAWTAWEQHEFRQVVHRLNLADVYAPFGYDFSFIR
jgi:hypothetical protein